MAKIAFILLCHKDPEAIVRQAQSLTAVGDYIAIHFDRSASPTAYRQIRAALADNPGVVFAKRRVRCGWGEWSLVEATLEALKAASATEWRQGLIRSWNEAGWFELARTTGAGQS